MTGRILVVEDDFFIATDIAAALEHAAFEVLGPCPTVLKAMAQLDRGRCDAAVLDASLRNESSLPVARVLAERGIAFVVVTGFSRSQLPAEMATVPVLSKPLHAEDLISHLDRLLSAR